LKDLRERFAKVEISASKPIVPFRETIVKAPGTPAIRIVVDGRYGGLERYVYEERNCNYYIP
jgi:hypothetical protein